MRHRARQAGFTFMEIVVSLAIIAVLTSICLPLAEVSVQRKKEDDLRIGLRQIRGALDAYRRHSTRARSSAKQAIPVIRNPCVRWSTASTMRRAPAAASSISSGDWRGIRSP